MTTTLVDLIGDVSDAIGTDFDPRRTKAYVRHNTAIVTTDDGFRLGGGTVNVNEDGTFTLPDVVAATTLVENLQATVYIDYADPTTRQRVTATLGPYDLSAETGTVDIRDLEEVQALDPSFASEFMTQAQELLDQQIALSEIDNTDSAVAYNVEFGTETPSALETFMGAQLGDYSTPAFIAEENRAVLTNVVVTSYYGTVGAGDDQAAIDNAIERASDQGGGTVILPDRLPDGPGVNAWRASQIVLPKWVRLRGTNWSSFGDSGSRIIQLSGVNDDLIVFDDNGDAATYPFVGPSGITDLVLIGNVSSTAGHGIAFRAQDGRDAKMQDMTTVQRVVTSYFAESGVYVPGGSPVVLKDIVGFWNKGFTVEIEDLAVDTSNFSVHHISLADISGDGNMGYEADGYGATVRLKGHRGSFGVTMRGIKGEFRILPGFAGGDGEAMGNYHVVILEDCDSDIDLIGITGIATGSQTRRPGPPVLVTGTTRRPDLTWAGVGIRGHHPTQTDDPETYVRVRDESQGVTVDYTVGHGELGPATDAAAVPDLTAGQAAFPMDYVNTAAGGWSTVTNNLRFSYWTARRTETLTTVRTVVSSGASGTTLARIGLYEVASNGDLTLVASTPNDTALWASTSADSKALSTPYKVKKNQRYAWGIIWIGTTTAPGMASQSGGLNGTELAKAPRKTGIINTGLTDLPSSASAGSVGNTSLRFYVAAE